MVRFTKEILNENLHILCSELSWMSQDSVNWGLLQDEYLERNFVIISYEKTLSHWVSSEYTR